VDDLDPHGRAVDQHNLVAPVELVGLAWHEAERHIGLGDNGLTLAAPGAGVAAHRIIAALVAFSAQRLEDAHQGQTLTRRLAGIGQKQAVEIRAPGAELGQGLHLALIGESRCA
jgi:hypothetical protein